jgi:hypothetical protein
LHSNVFEPRDAEQDAGAHGMFDEMAKRHDPWSGAVRLVGSLIRRRAS